MRRRFRTVVMAAICAAGVCQTSTAQNVTNYAAIPEPFLFLVREPAVHEDLALDRRQKSQLRALNEKYDADLLATRNKAASQAQATIDRVLAASRQEAGRILTPQQQVRLQQITFRLRGISFVLDPHAAEQIGLNDAQRASVEKIVTDSNRRIAAEQEKLNGGDSTQQKANLAVNRILRDQQKSILSVLSPPQRQQLPALLGRKFDPDTLGKVAFKAPELSDTGVWINTDGLQLADLRGKVIALHFWAFG